MWNIKGLRGLAAGTHLAIPHGMDAAVNKVGHEAVIIYNAQRIGRVALVVGRRGSDLILLDGGKRVTRWAGSCGTAYPTDNGQAENRRVEEK